jgi:hypothetical protein
VVGPLGLAGCLAHFLIAEEAIQGGQQQSMKLLVGPDSRAHRGWEAVLAAAMGLGLLMTVVLLLLQVVVVVEVAAVPGCLPSVCCGKLCVVVCS